MRKSCVPGGHARCWTSVPQRHSNVVARGGNGTVRDSAGLTIRGTDGRMILVGQISSKRNVIVWALAPVAPALKAALNTAKATAARRCRRDRRSIGILPVVVLGGRGQSSACHKARRIPLSVNAHELAMNGATFRCAQGSTYSSGNEQVRAPFAVAPAACVRCNDLKCQPD